MLSLAGGCNALDLAPLVTATTTISEEFKTTSSPKLVIETFNGSIDISEGEGDEVVVEVTKRAGGFDREAAEANLDLVEVQIVQKDEEHDSCRGEANGTQHWKQRCVGRR